MQAEDIRVFIPSKDYEESKRFYCAIGFEMSFESEDFSEFQNGECSFLLQNFYNKEMASNLMVQLVVNSVESVHENLKSLSDFKFSFNPPEDVPWGKILYLWGPSGELWHITQFNNS